MATPWTDARIQVTPAWLAVVPADAYLDARQGAWAMYEICGKIRFQRWGRYDELPKILIDAGLVEVIEALTSGLEDVVRVEGAQHRAGQPGDRS
jgi:hypothetical protein